MHLPSIVPTVRVRGTFLRLDGTPNAGSVWFESTQPLTMHFNSGIVTMDDVFHQVDGEWPVNSAQSLAEGPLIRVLPRRQAAMLNADGYFEIDLACNDEGATPTGWTYQVNEKIDGGRDEYSIELSHVDTGTGVNLITCPHVTEGTPVDV